MKSTAFRWLDALLAAIWSAASMAQLPNVERGQRVYVICGACHAAQAQGERRLNAPSLAGQKQSYLLRQLRNFRLGVRGGKGDSQAQQMRLILETVSSESDWKAVIAYVQSLPFPLAQPTFQGDIEVGRQLYQACSVCHGSNAEGNEALDAPNLRSLPDWYIVDELQKFRSGARGGAPGDLPGATMRAAASALRSDEDTRAVASFISSR